MPIFNNLPIRSLIKAEHLLLTYVAALTHKLKPSELVYFKEYVIGLIEAKVKTTLTNEVKPKQGTRSGIASKIKRCGCKRQHLTNFLTQY